MVCGSGCFCCSCYVFVPFYFEYLCTTICTNVLCTRDVSCCIVEEIVVPMQEGNCVLWTFALNWSKSRSNVHRLMVKCTFFSFLLNFILFSFLCGVLVPRCLELVWNLSVQVQKRQPELLGLLGILPVSIIIFASLRWSPSIWQSYCWKDSRGAGKRKAQPVDPRPLQLPSELWIILVNWLRLLLALFF